MAGLFPLGDPMSDYQFCRAKCCRTGTKESCHNRLQCSCHQNVVAVRAREYEERRDEETFRADQHRVTGNTTTGGNRTRATKAPQKEATA